MKAKAVRGILVSQDGSLRRPIPGEAGVQAGTRITSYGIPLLQTRKTIPVSLAFTGIPYLRMLAGHRRRIQKELAKIELREKLPSETSKKSALSTMPSLPNKTAGGPRRKWDEMKTVLCSKCRKILLGESEEWMREIAHAKTAARFPARIAKRIHEAPFCKDCAI